MKAQVIKKFGEASVFEEVEIPKPVLKPNHVLIRVHASSVNPLDYKLRKGMFPTITPSFPAILHGDVAGVIEAVADDVTSFKVGDEVYGCAGGILDNHGALADYMLASAALLAKKPKTLSMQEAAALPLVAITAWEALFDKVQVKPGQQILIHAGTGGVGHIAIQLAAFANAEVYTTVSSDEKAKIAKSLTPVETINYRLEKPEEYVNRLTKNNGFEIVFDTVGGDNINASIKAVSLYGNLITVLGHSNLDHALLHAKSASLHSVLMLIPLIYQIQRCRHGRILKQIAEMVDEGKLKPLIDPKQFSFSEVGKAHEHLQTGNAIGKIVLTNMH